MDHVEMLGRLAVGDARVAAAGLSGRPPGSPRPVLDAKTRALVGLAALVATGGAEPSFGAQVDAAVAAGASDPEMVGVLVEVIPVVGLPRAVAAASALALALGYDEPGGLG
ncbi:MAG: carboxymuconolactone decarboxylase family protein [Nocardioides sp.]